MIAALGDVEVGAGRRTPAARLHVTLRFLGVVVDEARPVLVDALATAVARESTVVARLGAATATFGRHVLHVPVAGLDGLAATVGAAVDAVVPGPAAADRPFVGHLTVARSRGRSRAADLSSVAGAVVPDAAREPWVVSQVTLVASAAGRYEVLEWFSTG